MSMSQQLSNKKFFKRKQHTRNYNMRNKSENSLRLECLYITFYFYQLPYHCKFFTQFLLMNLIY